MSFGKRVIGIIRSMGKSLFSKDSLGFLVFMYALGIVESYAVLPHWKGAEVYGNLYYELFLDLLILTFFISLIPRKIRKFPLRTTVRGIVYAIAYSLAIVDTFCMVQFGNTISPSMLLLVGETTGNETAEFLSTYVNFEVVFTTELGWVLLVLLAHIIYEVIKWKVKGVRYRLERIGRVFPYAFCLLSLLLIILGWSDTLTNKKCMVRHFNCQTVGDVEKDMNLHPMVVMYQPVYRLADAVFTNRLVSLQLDRLKAEAEKVERMTSEQLGIPQGLMESKPSNIVLIIGESYNKYHSQLYGYEKKNTPRQVKMEKSGRLVKFNDVMAPWNLTSFVFKHLMTTYTVGDNGDWCDYPLFCQLFRKAGYQVNFLTNQFLPHAKDAIFDVSGGFFINDEILSKVQFDVRNEETHLWDEDLLKDHARLIAPPEGVVDTVSVPSLTIFHLMGQHVNYRIRCPKQKMKFFQEDYDCPQNTQKEKRNIAFYDCAVWYNDSVVGAIVDRFKNDDAIIIYFPDHGDEVYGPGSLHHCGRNHTTNITKNIAQQEYEIPMWFYCTKKYAKRHPDIVVAIKKAKNKPFMTDAMSHLLLGLAGIKCKAYRPQLDLLSPQYNEKRQRLMQHLVDYDEIVKSK
jgi:heptose-I-phosphate ethanolaminephosphotransferase